MSLLRPPWRPAQRVSPESVLTPPMALANGSMRDGRHRVAVDFCGRPEQSDSGLTRCPAC